MDSVLPLHPHQDHSPSHPMELSQWTLQTSIKWADNWYETLQCISWEKNVVFILALHNIESLQSEIS